MCVLGLNKMNIWRIKGESWVGVFKSKLLPESLTVMVLHFSHKMSCSTSLVSDTAPVSQSTSEDRCWCLMGFLLCEWQLWGKDNNKKKTIMIICVWELRQPSTCFFFHQQRAWPWILYWYFVNLPQTLPSFHSFLLQLKLCHGLYIHLIIISLTPYDYKTRLELLGGHQLMFL